MSAKFEMPLNCLFCSGRFNSGSFAGKKIAHKLKGLLLKLDEPNIAENIIVATLELFSDVEKIIIHCPFLFDSSILANIGPLNHVKELFFDTVHIPRML